MPLPSDYISGTITLTNGSVDFTGTGTGWLAADFREGDIILDIAGGGGRVAVVQSITGNAAGTLSKAWDGPTLTGVAYRIRYQWDSSRVSAQTRTMIEKLGNGNLESFSGVTGPGVVVMDGPHSVTVKPESDFINGVAYDVQVDTLPDRDAYDGQSVGFAVLVSDVGDGRSAVYSKASNTVADWTDPAYVTGPVGPASTIEVSGTNTLPPGSPANVTATPVPGGVELEFDIPSGRGATPRGTYNPATTYVLDDSVLDNGSTWIALQTTTGNAPPVLPATSDANWQLLARKGTDGTGTGDVVGPASAVDGRFAAFDGTTGKLIKALTATAATAFLNIFSTVKGLVPGATSGDVAAGRLLRADGTWADPPVNDGLASDVSVIALQVADLQNVPLFGRSWFADAFDTLTYVDVSGATNLDTSTPGVLKPGAGGNDSFTKVLLHFDGTDGSTTITDANAGGSAHTWTANGNAQLDTGVTPKFGTASLLLDGTGDYVSTPDSVDFTLGSGPFTIDLWFNPAGAGTRRIMCGKSVGAADSTTSFFIELDASNRVVAYLGNGSTLTTVTGTSAFATAGWRHVEFIRTGNILRLFVNGVQEGGDVAFTGSVVDDAGILSVGAAGNFASLMWNGLIDEFRISVGIARHTANFTPPTIAYASGADMSVNYIGAENVEVPESMSAVIQVKEVSSAVPGTDYKVDFRRSVGGAWVEATLGEAFTTPSGIKYVKAEETDISGLPSGDIPCVRLRTLNSKQIEFHGIHVECYGANGGWQPGGPP